MCAGEVCLHRDMVVEGIAMLYEECALPVWQHLSSLEFTEEGR